MGRNMQWENVYIFISSTFNDMHAERDYLVKSVFPELVAWCEARKLRLIDIDLRWGVREEDTTVNKNTIKVCLDRIDECRPFFLCFLGQRRGWVPEEGDVSNETRRVYPDIGGYVGKYSITEMEIEHALMHPLRKLLDGREQFPPPAEHAFFFLRDGGYLDSLPAKPKELRQIYTNEHITNKVQRQLADTELHAWREKIKRGRYTDYTAQWDTDAMTPEIRNENIPGLDRGRLVDFNSGGEALKDLILRELKQAISEQFPDHTPSLPQNAYDIDIEQQQQFVALNKDGFIRREGDFNDLNGYVEGDNNVPFILTAPAGLGKSMLLANFAACRPERVVARFIGASDKSANIDSLWRSIFYELGKEVPSFPEELRQKLPSLLQEVGWEQKTVIVIDALNQLDTGLRDLGWLPRTLPEGIKLVASFREDNPLAQQVLSALKAEGKAILARVPPFDSDSDKRSIINAYLDQYLKALDEKHIQTICDMSGSENPLFLKVLLSELRVFGSFAQLGGLIQKQFGEMPLSAFTGVLERLEQDAPYGTLPPECAVPCLFGLLSCARRGLSEQELTLCFRTEFPEASEQEIRDTIRLYIRQMRSFLARRENRTDFLYESFALAARERYVAQKKHFNGVLAACFASLCDPSGDCTYEREDLRALSELGWHTRQHDGQAGEQLYTNLAYLHARCSAGGAVDLLLELSSFGEQENSLLAQYKKLLYRFREDLLHFPNLLFSIAMHNGFAEAQEQAKTLEPGWNRPWIDIHCAMKTSPVKNNADTDSVSINVEKRFSFPNTVAAQYAGQRDMVFYTEGLGCIRLLHTDTMLPDPGFIGTRVVRPLTICCSEEGTYIAVTFEDMTADVIAVHYNADGSLAYAETVAQVDYLLPLYDDGVFLVAGDQLYYQEKENEIVRIDLGTVGKTHLPLPDPGELSGAVCAGNKVFFSVRCYDDTDFLVYENDNLTTQIRQPGLDVACMVAADGGVAVSFRDGTLVAYSDRLEQTAIAKPGHPMKTMCHTDDRLFCLSELHNISFLWNYKELLKGDNERLGGTRSEGLKPYEDGRMLYVSDTTAVVFSVGGQAGSEGSELIAAFEESPGNYVAVARVSRSVRIYNTTDNKALSVPRDAMLYAVHTPGEVSVINNTGKGYVLSSSDLYSRDVTLGVSNVSAIAASDAGGYYFYDGAGFLHQHPWHTKMPNIIRYHLSSLNLYAFGNRLVLLGISDDVKAGTEHKNYLALFYRILPGGYLVPEVERYFDTDYGNFITMTTNENRYYILFSTPNSGIRAANPVLRYGTLQEFSKEREQAIELHIPKQRVSMCCKGGALYICAGGMLFVYNTESLEYLAAASAEERFRQVAGTTPENSEVFAIEGKNCLVYIQMKGSI